MVVVSSYLGQLGRLVKVKCPSNQSTERSERYTFSRTLEGRVKAQLSPLSRRSWTVDVSTATPSDMGALMAFVLGEWGDGPFVWVAEGAAVTNMLTPEVGACGPAAVVSSTVSMAGPLQLPDGSWAGRSLSNPAPSPTLRFGPDTTPVIPGGKVTASAFVVGAGSKVGVQFRNASGAVLSQFTSAQTGVAGGTTRLAVTATAPATAASCTVYATGTTLAARPALTWTEQVMEWGEGQGCTKAVITAPSQRLVLALADPLYGRYSDVSFTIQEVG